VRHFYRLLVALLLLPPLHAAQAGVAITDVEQPVSLAGGWLFQQGDNPAWSAPAFDDSGWQATQVPAHHPAGHSGLSGVFWYRLWLELDRDSPSIARNKGALGLRLGEVMNAYEVYIGGRLQGRIGQFPPEPRGEHDRQAVWPIPVEAIDDEGRVLVALRVWRAAEVGDHWESGPYGGTFAIGAISDLQRDLSHESYIPTVPLVAIYLVMGLYHLLIAARNPVLREFYWFGLFSLLLAGYTFESSQARFLFDLDYNLHKRIEHVLLYFAPVLWMVTAHSVTRTRLNPLMKGFGVIFLGYTLVAAVVPSQYILLQTLRSFQVLAALWTIALGVTMALRAYRGSRSAQGLTALMVLLVLAILNDVLLADSFLASGNTLYIVFALMLLFVALMMAERYTQILKQLELSVEDRTEELERVNLELESALEAKGQFLATVSHELRTPMNAIRGLTRLGLDTELTDQQRDYLEKVEASSIDLQDLIDSMFDFVDMEDGKLVCVSEPFAPAELVRRLEQTWRSDAEMKALTFSCELDPGLPDRLLGDAKHLRQAIGNLLSNGIKFTDEGGVTLAIELVRLHDSAAEVRIAVSDTGIGIDAVAREKLFGAFSQADGSMTREYGGTGLGLPIAARLVQLMGGQLSVSSEVGKGSTFAFHLTLPREQASSVESGSGLAGIVGARILLVDDSQLNLQVAGELLKKARVYVDMAQNGQEAVEMAAAVQYDCILMDVQMPVMDGYTATETIRKMPKGGDVPILAMTANALPADRDRGAQAGISDYIPKPIDPDELYAGLVKWITPGQRDYEAHAPAVSGTGPGVAELPDELPGIDVRGGLQRVAGNVALYVGLLSDLRAHYADVAGRIEALAEAGNLKDAGELAHKLKGVANNLGVYTLGERASDLEQSLRAGANPGSGAYAKLAEALAVALESQAVLAAAAEREDTGEALDEGESRALYEEVLAAVEESNPEALELTARLLGSLTEEDPNHALVAAAHDALDEYDFVTAEAMLRAVEL